MFPARFFPSRFFPSRFFPGSAVADSGDVIVRGGWRRDEEGERHEERFQREKRRRRVELEQSIRRAYERHFRGPDPEPEQVEELVEALVAQPAFAPAGTLEYLIASMQLDTAVSAALATIAWQLADEEDAVAMMVMGDV